MNTSLGDGLSWLSQLAAYIKTKSYGLAAIRVLEYNGITFGIIEPYGYFVFNYRSEIFVLRESNVAIKFFVRDEKVVTSVSHTGQVSMAYIDTLFANPPGSSSKIEKFILWRDKYPRRHTIISLINKCLDLRIFHL